MTSIESPKNDPSQPSNNSNKNAKQCLTVENGIKLTMICIILTIVILAMAYNKIAQNILTEFLEWMEDNLIVGALIYMLVYVTATVLLIPGLILTVGAGFVFMQVLNLVRVFVGIYMCIVC